MSLGDGQARQLSMLATVVVTVGTLAVVWMLSTGGTSSGFEAQGSHPLGSFEFVIVHLLAALPLSIWIADRVARQLRFHKAAIAGFCAILGVGQLRLMLACDSALASFCRGFSSIECALFRTGIAVGLLFPWCLASRLIATSDNTLSSAIAATRKTEHFAWAFILVAIAVAAPETYLFERIPELSAHAESLVKSGRYWQAWQTLNLLDELGSNRVVLNQLPGVAADVVAEQIRQLLRDVSQPLNANADLQTRLQRARNLASLDQFDAAEQSLGDLPQHDPAACLLSAAIQQQRQQWSASARSCRVALEMLAANGNHVRADKDILQTQAYDALITNYCNQRNFAAAEAVLPEALAAVPSARAYFYFRAGQYDQLAGRHANAASYYKNSLDISAAFKVQIMDGLQAMNQEMSGCIFSPAFSSIRQISTNH